MKKGGNAVGATRKQPLGRASTESIGYRRFRVKGVLRRLVQICELWTSLISGAPTGKIDVRQEVA